MSSVGLIFGGRSAEHKVSVASARTLSNALDQAGHAVVPLGIGPNGAWIAQKDAQKALDGQIDELPDGELPILKSLNVLMDVDVDVYFPVIHGTWGEDGTLQGMLEMLDVPYVGAGVGPSAVAMDKVICKQLLEAHGIPVVEYQVVTGEQLAHAPEKITERAKELSFPLFVKPAIGGSSVGVTKVREHDDILDAIGDALRFSDRVLIERGIEGRELECSVLGYREIKASIIGEIVAGKEFYDYADKYLDDGSELIIPANIPENLAKNLRNMARDSFLSIDGWGMARVDFLLDGDDRAYVNEINTIPGFTKISMYPMLWNKSGLSMEGLMDELISIALKRHRDRRKLDEGIKSFIASISKSDSQ